MRRRASTVGARRELVGPLLAGALLLGCGDDAEPEAPDAELVLDVRDLQVAVTDERALGSLEEVDEAVADDLPVRAAELLEAGAIPAAERHVGQLRDLPMRTASGRGLRAQAVEVLQARADALEQYRAALERGLVEDVTLLEALGAQRRAEEEVDAFLGELEAIRPLDPEEEGRRVRRPSR